MSRKVHLPTILGIFVFLSAYLPGTIPGPTPANMDNLEFTKSLESFDNKLFSELSKEESPKNIIYSPFSIQTCVAMARVGANGETAAQIDRALSLKSQNTDTLANNFYTILSPYENSNSLKMANKMYIMKDFEVQDTFNELLTKKFLTSAENIDFADKATSAPAINSWVAAKTNNLIQNIISPNDLSEKTRLVLLNAIHFKGEWLQAFPAKATRDQEFYTDETHSVMVPMMQQTGRFKYGDIAALDATVLEMPYKDSDLSMLVILPKSRTGFKDVKKNLNSISLHEIIDNLYESKVIVSMPKFKAEFEIELSDALQKLGMKNMFSSDAEFGNLLKSPEIFQVSKVIHKAFIEVNEKGTEAAAATGIIGLGFARPGPPEIVNRFIVDHGFYYLIVNSNGVVFFQGAQLQI